MGLYIMAFQIVSIHDSSNRWLQIASSIVLKSRLSEIGCESAIGDPSGCLLELNQEYFTLLISSS